MSVPVDVVVPLLELELELDVEPVLLLELEVVPVAAVLLPLTVVPTVPLLPVATLVPVVKPVLLPTVAVPVPLATLAPPEPTAPGFSQLHGGSGVGLKHAHLFPGPRQLTAIARMNPDTAQATVRRARGL